MSNPTIKHYNTNVTFTFQDGDVEEVKIQKVAQLDENPMPASDSDGAFVMDFSGVIKTITLTGNITPAASTRTDSGSTTTIAEQIAWLLTLVDGSQSGHTLSTTWQSSKTVWCRRVSFDEVSGKANVAPFTAEFVEGA